jgi:hypothetical protein
MSDYSHEAGLPMLVLYWTSTIAIGPGKVLAYPIGVTDESLDAFCERLTREGGAMVWRLDLKDGPDRCKYIRDEQRVFISIAATATLRDYNHSVRREVD